VSAALKGSVSKAYDGTNLATLTPDNYLLTGFVNGDSASVTKTSGIYIGKNVGSGLSVSTTLASTDFSPVGQTQLSNYTLPTTASGNIGEITPLTVTLSAPVVSKTYDGGLTYATTPADLSRLSAALVGGDLVSAATLGFTNKNAGADNKAVTLSGVTLNDGNGGGNYNVTLAGNSISTITPASVTLSAPVVSKTYDGTTSYTTTAADLLAISTVLVGGDSVATASLTYADKNAGSGNKVVSLNALTISDGNGGANYTVTTSGNANSTITPLTQVTWSSARTIGNWSDPASWTGGLVPDGANVLAVSVLNGAAVTYDLTTPTTVQAINMTGSFTMSTGNLAVTGNLSTPNYTQTAGSLSGGSLTVSNSFSQSSGATIGMTGPVSITQASGPLKVGKITAPSITLQASTGAIDQWISTDPANPNGLTGVVTLRTTGGATLKDTANRVSGFAVADVVSGGVSTRSSGNIALTNAAVLDVSGISLASGNLSVDNTGGISNSGAIYVDGGTLDIKAHSPITINSPVTASGNILLVAGNVGTSTPVADPTSNITINGSITSTAGGISIQAYNNFIQNSNLSAALAIDVSAGGSMFFGPGAYSVGNPVTYMVNGAPYMPPWIASTLSGGATDFVVAFLDQFQAVLDAQQVASIDDPLGLAQRGQEGIVVEGEICKP
jgi:hypothetical protein